MTTYIKQTSNTKHVASFIIEISPLLTKISRHAKELFVNGQTTDG